MLNLREHSFKALHKEAQIIFADCSSSHTGLFFGSAVMVVVIVVCIFVLVQEGGCSDPALAFTLGNWLQIAICLVLLAATLYTYFVMSQFDINPHPISFLDDMLLFFCMPSFFLYAIICLGPSVFIEFEAEFFVRNLLILLQVLVQTPMIVDGLRRQDL